MRIIRTALLSYGLSGKVFHAPFLDAHPGFQLVGAWERSKKQISADYPGSRSFSSLAEVLNDPAIDMVVVNTPTRTHYEFASQSLRAGKHVVVEKAFTCNTEEAVKLNGLALQEKKLLSVYQNRRWDGDFLTVKSLLEQNLIGEVVEAQISFDRFNPAIGPKAHREDPGPGAGNLMDLGPHCIDEALVLFGMPIAVFADLRTCRKGSRVDDYFEILLYYPDLRVRLHSSYLVREPGPGFILHGRAGTFLKSQSNIQETQLRQGIKPTDPSFGVEVPGARGWLIRAGTGQREPVESHRGNYLGFFDQLHAAWAGKGPVPVSGEEGIRVMRILDAAAESSRQGKVINL